MYPTARPAFRGAAQRICGCQSRSPLFDEAHEPCQTPDGGSRALVDVPRTPMRSVPLLRATVVAVNDIECGEKSSASVLHRRPLDLHHASSSRPRCETDGREGGHPTRGRALPGLHALTGVLGVGRSAPRWVGPPIGIQESRHTAATWLDHAHVSPKVASVFMGHKAPKRHLDAAPITLRRYTHVLPRELERARDQLQSFLDEREADEADMSFAI